MNLTKDYNQLPFSKILFHFGFTQASQHKRFNLYNNGPLDLAVYRIDEIKFSCINLRTFENYNPYQLAILLQPSTIIKDHQAILDKIIGTSFKLNDLNIIEVTKPTQIIRLVLSLKRFKKEKISWLTEMHGNILNSETFYNKIFISNDQISLPLFVKNSVLNFYHQNQHNHAYHNTLFDCNWISNNPGNAKRVLIATDLFQVLKFLENKPPMDYQILIIPEYASLDYLQVIHKFLSHSAIDEIILISGPKPGNFQLSFKFLTLDIISQKPDLFITTNSYDKIQVTMQSNAKDFKFNYMKLTTSLNNTIRERLKIDPRMKFEETDEFSKFYIFQSSGNSYNKKLKTISFTNNELTNEVFINTFSEVFSVKHKFSFVNI